MAPNKVAWISLAKVKMTTGLPPKCYNITCVPLQPLLWNPPSHHLENIKGNIFRFESMPDPRGTATQNKLSSKCLKMLFPLNCGEA